MVRDGSLAGSPTPLLWLGNTSFISFLVDFMAALVKSLELLPGISVMWTPPELLCTQFETDFKDALLLVFKRKFYCPQRGSIPWLPSSPAFPFLHRTAAPLKCSCPCSLPASNLTHQHEIMFPPPLSLSPAQGLRQSSRVLWMVSSSRSRSPAEGHPGIAAGLSPTPSLGPGHGVWGSQAGSSASQIAQMLKLEQFRGTNLFSQQSQFSPF